MSGEYDGDTFIVTADLNRSYHPPLQMVAMQCGTCGEYILDVAVPTLRELTEAAEGHDCRGYYARPDDEDFVAWPALGRTNPYSTGAT